MPYRDDLEAAQIRITELEEDLEGAREKIDVLRSELVRKGRRKPWGWLAIGGISTLVLVGAGAGQVLYAQDHVAERNVAELRELLREAEADAAQAREDSRAAFEMMSQAQDQQQQQAVTVPEVEPDRDMEQAVEAPSDIEPDEALENRDPFVRPSGWLKVISDRPARVGVDGASVYEWTPTTIKLTPGQHAISVIAEDGRVRRHTVTIRRGQSSNLTVYFSTH